MPSARPTVLIADSSIHTDGIALLKNSASLTLLPAHAPQHELLECSQSVDAILARAARISREVVEGAPHLKIVSRHGVGVDNVDVAACTERGIVVSTTGDANSEAVSELTFALLLACARRIPQTSVGFRAGTWERDSVIGVELWRKCLGIVGLGRIGRRVARHARGFDMRVLAFDPYLPADTDQEGVPLVDLPTLLQEADFVTLNLPLTDETRGLIGAEQLAWMKPSAILINTSRGKVVDERALYRALCDNRLAGAALDVFAEEPVRFPYPLAELPNFIGTPHVAGQTVDALRRMSVGAATNILRVLRGELPEHIVNPEVIPTTTRIRWKGVPS